MIDKIITIKVCALCNRLIGFNGLRNRVLNPRWSWQQYHEEKHFISPIIYSRVIFK